MKQLEEYVFNLSHQKWDWMAGKDADNLELLFDEESVFVHMGGAWGKQQELQNIRSGMIHYKKTTIHNESIRFVDSYYLV